MHLNCTNAFHRDVQNSFVKKSARSYTEMRASGCANAEVRSQESIAGWGEGSGDEYVKAPRQARKQEHEKETEKEREDTRKAKQAKKQK
jgi:hypothetical protein